MRRSPSVPKISVRVEQFGEAPSAGTLAFETAPRRHVRTLADARANPGASLADSDAPSRGSQ
jgi:hypothetical protein